MMRQLDPKRCTCWPEGEGDEAGHDGDCQAWVADGTEPRMMEHLCIKDLTIQPGPVEDCCINEWRDQGAEP